MIVNLGICSASPPFSKSRGSYATLVLPSIAPDAPPAAWTGGTRGAFEPEDDGPSKVDVEAGAGEPEAPPTRRRDRPSDIECNCGGCTGLYGLNFDTGETRKISGRPINAVLRCPLLRRVITARLRSITSL